MFKYHELVNRIITTGKRKTATRGGIDTIGVFNHNYVHDLDDGLPVLTTKKISWKNIVVENLWFLSGDPSVDFLHKHGVHFWDPWVVNVPVKCIEIGRTTTTSDFPNSTMYKVVDRKLVPSAYGNFWRRFKNPVETDGPGGDGGFYSWVEDKPVDQVAWAIDKLKKNPNTRQACITSWDPRNTKDSSLPPCHVFHVLNYYDGRLNLHLTQRSCDVALGLPYNMAGYGGFLLPLYARLTGLKPGVFAHSIVDSHIYTKSEDGSNAEYDHVPGLIEQMLRRPRDLPTIKIDDSIKSLRDVEDLVTSNATTEDLLSIFKLEGYDPHPNIPFKPAV